VLNLLENQWRRIIMKVYLDNGATTRVDPKVVEDMIPYFTDKYGNASSLHDYGREAKEALDKARETIASKINAYPEEIIFTSGGSESNNTLIRGYLLQYPEKKHIITSIIEHPSVLGVCRDMQMNHGYEVTYLKVGKEGLISIEELKKAIRKDTALISIMHANNEIGTIQPIEEIGQICRKEGIIFHTDCVQSLTKVDIDVKKANITFASFSAHKVHGPKGVGAMFVKKGTKFKKMIHGGHHEFDKRAGTENIPGIVGFAKAVLYATPDHVSKMTKLRDKLINRLLSIPNTQLNGARDKRLCNNANIAFNFVEGESLLLHLDMEGIAVSTGSACSSSSLKPSHVLMAIGMKAEVAHGSIRFTLSRFTTEEEIDYTVEKVTQTVKMLRDMSPLAK
jgi:cysteine desulfurase